MKPKAVSGVLSLSDNLPKTAEFYEKLGFIVACNRDDLVTVRLNWFWLDFVPTDNRQVGSVSQFIYLSVVNVDEVYVQATKAKLPCLSEPQTFKAGRREFMIEDPNGYKLVFFEKK